MLWPSISASRPASTESQQYRVLGQIVCLQLATPGSRGLLPGPSSSGLLMLSSISTMQAANILNWAKFASVSKTGSGIKTLSCHLQYQSLLGDVEPFSVKQEQLVAAS